MTEVVAALIWDGDRFLICQRPAHKARGLLWEFVGGKVEPGETKAQALIRECREELAVTVTPGPVFMEVTHVYPDLTVHLTLFAAAIAAGTPQLLEHHDKHQEQQCLQRGHRQDHNGPDCRSDISSRHRDQRRKSDQRANHERIGETENQHADGAEDSQNDRLRALPHYIPVKAVVQDGSHITDLSLSLRNICVQQSAALLLKLLLTVKKID